MNASATNVAAVAFLVVAWGLIVFAMYKGWKRKATRQQEWIGELPPAPEKLGAVRVEQTTGLYIGTTFAENWQARVASETLGARAEGTLTGYPEGILLERAGTRAVWIPRKSILEVRTDKRLAGKVMTEDGLLVVRWHPPGSSDPTIEIDSGFRGDDKTVYPQWITEFNKSQGNSGQGREASK